MIFSRYFSKSTGAEKIDFSVLYQCVLSESAADMPIDPVMHRMLQSVSSEPQSGKVKIAVIGDSCVSKAHLLTAWAEQPLSVLSELNAGVKIGGNFSSYDVAGHCVTGEFSEAVNDAGRDLSFANVSGLERFNQEIFVADAHLLLYVVNANNPMKTFQDEKLFWLFHTLGLLPRTIFVLDRFDEVVDVEDDNEYQSILKLKRNTLIQGLAARIGLDSQDIEALSVVAIASNPFCKGLDYWLKNIPEYRELSKISQLHRAIESVKEKFSKNALHDSRRTCLARHILDRQLALLADNEQKISTELSALTSVFDRFRRRLSIITEQLDAGRIALVNFSDLYYSDLILQVQCCGLEEFNDFFEREIGGHALKVSLTLKKEINRQVNLVGFELNFLLIELDAEVERFKNFGKLIKQDSELEGIGKKLSGFKYSAQTHEINFTESILGHELSDFLKSKKWTETSYVKGITSFMPVVGVAVDVWEKWDQGKKEAGFREIMAELTNCFKNQQMKSADLFEQGAFNKLFFRDYLQLVDEFESLSSLLDSGRARLRRLRKWKAKMELLSAGAS